MKTRIIKSSIIFALLLMLLIISVLAISVIIDDNESEQISLSLIPNNGTRPTSSDFSMLGSRLVTYTGDATTIRATDFPQGVETIGVNAFSTSNVEYVELPQSVKTIEGYAFYACDSLKNIIIPSGCTSVGMSAFNSCYGLENVMLQFDNPNVFSSTAFAFVTHDFNIYVPKDSYDSFYNSSRFSSVKDNLQTWNITLTIEDYTNGEDYTADIAFGETVTLPTPIKEGYAFTGLTDSLNNEYETTFRWMSLDDCNLTANWEIKEFEVVYNGRDGKQYYLTRTGLTATPTKITYGVLLDNDIIQTLYEDFRNEGEYLASVKINNISVSNGTSIWDLGQDNGRFILDLNFAQKHYNLRFDSTYEDLTFANIDNLQFGDQVILPTIPAGTKIGYLFDYWYVTNNTFSGSRVVDFEIVPDCDPDNNSAYINMWLEPRFAPKTYNVYLNANGGTCSSSSKTVTYDRYPSFPTPTRSGYRFMGWEYNNERVDNRNWTIDQNNITVKAMWEKLYTITLDTDGGEVSGGGTLEVIYGENIGEKLPTPTKDKHKFLYWTYNGQRIYDYTAWNVRANGTVKAIWEELYRITLDAKGGSVSPAYIDLEEGQSIPTLPVATKAGYDFSGWYLDSIDFDPSNYQLQGDITLTTKWWNQVTLTDEQTYTVTQDCTYVYLDCSISQLIYKMIIYIDSNVENVKFASRYFVSNKTIIVKERTTPLTIEFGTYQAIGFTGNAALDASACDDLNIIARGTYCDLHCGISTSEKKIGGLICNNVNFYGEQIKTAGGIAGSIDNEDSNITQYYNPGMGLYASGNINVNCEKLTVIGGVYLVSPYRNGDTEKSSQTGSAGLYIDGSYNINIASSSTLEVTGGDGLSNDGNDYVSDGGYAIYTNGISKIKGYGTLIATGGAGGDNKEPSYNEGEAGKGGLAINYPNLQVDETINKTLSQGPDGEKNTSTSNT